MLYRLCSPPLTLKTVSLLQLSPAKICTIHKHTQVQTNAHNHFLLTYIRVVITQNILLPTPHYPFTQRLPHSKHFSYPRPLSTFYAITAIFTILFPSIATSTLDIHFHSHSTALYASTTTHFYQKPEPSNSTHILHRNRATDKQLQS